MYIAYILFALFGVVVRFRSLTNTFYNAVTYRPITKYSKTSVVSLKSICKINYRKINRELNECHFDKKGKYFYYPSSFVTFLKLSPSIRFIFFV